MSDRYAAERGIPSVPTCARSLVFLRFNGSALIMSGPVSGIYAAVSGRPDGSGHFDYAPDRQSKRNIGPIPAGRYWIQPSQMWENHWYNVSPRAAWGDHRITIHIYPGTQTYGRGGFFIHGGIRAGSAGCINLRSRMEAFVLGLKKAVASSPDCYIPLTVGY